MFYSDQDGQISPTVPDIADEDTASIQCKFQFFIFPLTLSIMFF